MLQIACAFVSDTDTFASFAHIHACVACIRRNHTSNFQDRGEDTMHLAARQVRIQCPLQLGK